MFTTTLTRRPTLRPRAAHRDPFFSLVDRVFNEGPLSTLATHQVDDSAERTWVPPVDIIETDSAFVATVDLPGLTKESIDLSLEDNVLTLSGQRTYEKNDDAKVRRNERSFGSFSRTFSLPSGVDGSKVSANFENGVLSLTLPKSEVAQLRKIEIA